MNKNRYPDALPCTCSHIHPLTLVFHQPFLLFSIPSFFPLVPPPFFPPFLLLLCTFRWPLPSKAFSNQQCYCIWLYQRQLHCEQFAEYLPHCLSCMHNLFADWCGPHAPQVHCHTGTSPEHGVWLLAGVLTETGDECNGCLHLAGIRRKVKLNWNKIRSQLSAWMPFEDEISALISLGLALPVLTSKKAPKFLVAWGNNPYLDLWCNRTRLLVNLPLG